MSESSHESFAREEKFVAGSDRSFGYVMAGALSILAVLNWWHAGHSWPWTSSAAALFLVAAVVAPGALGPLNKIWMKFGLLLHKAVNPLIMGVVFYITVLPTGVMMRMFGRDLLRLKLQPNADSYWIPREPRGPAPESMKDQF